MSSSFSIARASSIILSSSDSSLGTPPSVLIRRCLRASLLNGPLSSRFLRVRRYAIRLRTSPCLTLSLSYSDAYLRPDRCSRGGEPLGTPSTGEGASTVLVGSGESPPTLRSGGSSILSNTALPQPLSSSVMGVIHRSPVKSPRSSALESLFLNQAADFPVATTASSTVR